MPASVTHTAFTVPLHHHLLAATITRPANQPDLKPTVLVLHGAGDSNQTHALYLAEFLAENGIATLRFDQTGHGLSTGTNYTSSLRLKVEEALAMLPFMEPPIHVIASSMGATTACHLIPRTRVASLTFIAPAIYGEPHHTVPFGPDFQFFLTLPGFWRSSPCWPLLENFTGKLLLLTAGREERVPAEVAKLLQEKPKKAQLTLLHYPHSPHAIQAWLNKHPQDQQAFLQTLLKTVSKS